MTSAVSPPHAYAKAVAKLYMNPGKRRLRSIQPSSQEMANVAGVLRMWRMLPKEAVMKAFEAGNFAGVEEMKANDRLFERVAPLGVNDILMAVQYDHRPRPPLPVPLLALQGAQDATMEPHIMREWAGYTSAVFRYESVPGDHYFVAHRAEDTAANVARVCLDALEGKSLQPALGGQLSDALWAVLAALCVLLALLMAVVRN
ncbi:hypothetical protein H632_c5012p0 [Helicosporidium sp. ATCC 50920]|nr:hypothetical protein H632_c5012p0 [Helicosporidium sp. ATCC 50920]|eukprot:KDD71443.1 hypothetical protein H632_c5012p0 [Helicosporidium sp. ATCC 50920]